MGRTSGGQQRSCAGRMCVEKKGWFAPSQSEESATRSHAPCIIYVTLPSNVKLDRLSTDVYGLSAAAAPSPPSVPPPPPPGPRPVPPLFAFPGPRRRC